MASDNILLGGLGLSGSRERRCSFCWEFIDESADIMILPCEHLCCQPCKDEFLRLYDVDDLTCSQCSRAFTWEETTVDPARETKEGKPRCDAKECGENQAAFFCVLCDKKCCVSHVQKHNATHASEVVLIQAYEQSILPHKPVYCEVHSSHQLDLACSKCDQLACAACKTSQRPCSDEDTEHDFQAVQAVADMRMTAYRRLVDEVQMRVTRICSLSKEAWNKLDASEELCTRALKDIEKFRQGKVGKSGRDVEQAIEDVKEYRENVTDQVVNWDKELMKEKDVLFSLVIKLCKIIREGHPTEKVSQRQKFDREVQRLLAKETISCTIKEKRLIYRALPGATQVAFVGVPSSLTPISSHRLDSWCYSSWHRKNGDILIGCEAGLWCLEHATGGLLKCQMTMRRVTSVVEHNDLVYVLHEHGSSCTVDVFEADMSGRRTLFTYPNTSGRAASMTVSDKFILAYSPDLQRHFRQVILYDILNDEKVIHNGTDPTRPHFLPDGNVAAVSRNKLRMCRLEKGELEEVWRCKDLEDLHRVVLDPSGLIWGPTYEKEKIYIISPAGEKLKTLTGLPPFLGEVSVRGDQLAVPTWKEKSLNIYKINYT